MMRILERGGIPPLADNIRAADEDNPLGYYEYEMAKELKKDSSFLDAADGKAIKMVSQLLYDLPEGKLYSILFMERDLREMLVSQRKMLARQGKPSPADDSKLLEIYGKHLEQIHAWLKARRDIAVERISYNALLSDAAPSIDRVIAFLQRPLDRAAMLQAIDPKLYRNRTSSDTL